MRQKYSYDMVLLKKIFEQGTMTTIEVSEMFETSVRKAGELRKECGFVTAKKLTCNVCGDDKAVNCFNSKHAGICIKCRRTMGLEKQYGRFGGRPKVEAVQTVRAKCLKCSKPFLTRLDIFGQKLNRICPICTKTNKYLGTEEGYYGNVGQTSYNVLRFG